jgi:hypothetical protein
LFCGIHKEAKPFCNRGWVHLERMSEIMPATVCGMNVFCPSQGLSGLDHGRDHDDTPDASQEGPSTQDTAVDELENSVVEENLDVMSQVSAAVPLTYLMY